MHLLFGEKAPARLADDKPEGGTFFARVTKDVDLVLNLIQLDRDFDDQAEPFGALLMQNLYQQESGRQFWVKGVRLAES